MENLPSYIGILLMLTTFFAIWIFYKALGLSKPFLMIGLIWLITQSILALRGFYKVTNTLPPRFFILVGPPFLLAIILLITRRGRKLIDQWDLEFLTLIHIARIPVEIVLFFLFLHKAVPRIMTFEGRNLDIISGLTAPVMYYIGFKRKVRGRKLLLFWNLGCLCLLINVVVTALLSAPFSFQSLGFEQPNIAVLYFPFIWLPCCIVPLVLISHLASIRLLIRGDKKVRAENFSKINLEH